MKKSMKVVAVVMAGAMTALTGCGSIGTAPSAAATTTTAGSGTSAETQAAGAESKSAETQSASGVDESIPKTSLNVEGDEVELSLFAGSIPQNTATGEALGLMTKYINENSNGTIKATDFYDTALGNATSMVQGLQQGTINIGVSGTAYFSGLVPDVDVYQLPFLFSDLETARAATASDSKSCQAIFEKLESKGLVGLSFWENGFRELTNNVREVSEPEDLKGIKMRTLPNDVQKATWEAMGAITSQIDASELYTALQQGTVQAQDNPLHEIVARKFYEVQPYVTLTDAVYTPFLMAMSKTTYDSMSESQQQLIKEAADWAREKQIEITDKNQATALQTLKDNGCKVQENPDKDAFKEIAKTTWHIYTDANGTEILNMIEQ